MCQALFQGWDIKVSKEFESDISDMPVLALGKDVPLPVILSH